MSDAVIDLGDRSAPTLAPEPPAGRRAPRRGALAVAAAVLVAVSGGAAPLPAPPPPVIIPAAAGDHTFVAGDRYVVISPDPGPAAPDRPRTAVVYALADGSPQSRTPVPLPGLVTTATLVLDTLVVTHQTDQAGGVETVGLTVGTGEVRWRYAAEFVALTPTARLAILLQTAASTWPLRWSGVDVATGSLVWAYPVPPTGATDLVWAASLEHARHVFAVSPTGRFELRDPETGAVTAAAELPAPPQWRTEGIGLGITGDLVLLGSSAGFTAYDLPTLTPRWRSAVDLTDVFTTPVCGDVICLFGRFGGIRVLNPVTGAERWRAAGWGTAQRVDGYLLTSRDRGPDRNRTITVLDVATGRPHTGFAGWRALGGARPDGRIVGVREATPEHRVWYGVLDPAAGSVRVLGAAEPVSDDCQLSGSRLVCRRLDATVGVWQLGG